MDQFGHLVAWLDFRMGRIEKKLNLILREEMHMSNELDTLEADVAAEETVIGSVETLLTGLKAELDAAIAAGDMSRVAAVTANTPAPPAPAGS